MDPKVTQKKSLMDQAISGKDVPAHQTLVQATRTSQTPPSTDSARFSASNKDPIGARPPTAYNNNNRILDQEYLNSLHEVDKELEILLDLEILLNLSDGPDGRTSSAKPAFPGYAVPADRTLVRATRSSQTPPGADLERSLTSNMNLISARLPISYYNNRILDQRSLRKEYFESLHRVIKEFKIQSDLETLLYSSDGPNGRVSSAKPAFPGYAALLTRKSKL